MQRAARQVQPSLSAFRSVTGLPRGIAAVLPAALSPSTPPPTTPSQSASRAHRVLAAVGGVDTATRSDMSAASEVAPAGGAHTLESELQHACVAVRLASALCQARLTLLEPLTTQTNGCTAYASPEWMPIVAAALPGCESVWPAIEPARHQERGVRPTRQVWLRRQRLRSASD